MKKHLALLLLISFSVTSSGADFMMISDIGASAETIALGNVEGFNQSASTIFENPAGLYRIPHQSLALFSSTIMDEVHYSNIAISSVTPYGSIGFGFMQAAVFDLDETYLKDDLDKSVDSKGKFDYKNTLYKLSYQKSVLKNLSVGASTVFYNTNFYDVRGNGYDFDAGVIWNKGPFSTSLFARNVLPHGKVKFNEQRFEPLPFHLVGSAKWSYRNLDILPQLKVQQENILPSLGFCYTPISLPFIDFLAGYKQQLTATNKNKQNLTFGIGLNLYGLHFNYAYERSDYIPQDNKSYFSINTSF